MAMWMNDPMVITLGLVLAVFRIYLEVVNFDFARLPVTQKLMGEQQATRFHKYGFYLSLGYFVLFAPGMLFA